MAKQSFVTGQVLTAAQMTSLQQTAMGGGSATAKTASYTLVAADAGTVVRMNAASATTITVNTSLFAAGDTVYIQNIGAGVCTITAGTATVNTASSLALAQYEGGTLYFTAASASLFFKAAPAAAGGGGATYAVFYDLKTNNTAGGTFTSGAWRTRDLQTTGLNQITGASLASNQITLPAGTYVVDAYAPFYRTDTTQAAFYNITDSSFTIVGQTGYIAGNMEVQTASIVSGAFTIAAQKVFELQHIAATTRSTTGFGQNNGNSVGEVYSIITIAKVA